MRRILGVDPSSHTGWAVVDRKEGLVETGTVHADKEISYRIRRFDDIAERLVQDVYLGDIAFAVVENYIHTGRFVNRDQYELGALIRRALMGAGIAVCEASPTSVKKFATGNGRATKKQMVAAAQDLWGFEGKDDNQADAIAIAYMGLVLDGAVGVPMACDLSVVEKLGKPLL